ncbi:DNA topoisomerase 4 subunit A [Christensenellaceae bacterium OttesenSCG-928-L17]|nr:DNA topoisomerase 4 subunit A [Christensenellaceae bacterium OttesenSCG-928-L17]
MAKKKAGPPATPPRGETIILQNMDDVMHHSMMPYAEHVILERALPRVEDGLKPVQRRILYTMLELGLSPDKPHRKSARIVGDALGKYHPHGDSSVYDAMVRMAQWFNMRAPLVDGHGNFGSIDGDCAAAMRYTEARMTPLAMELLRDLEKDTIDYTLNFDDTLQEPVLLPGRFPNLLVNGASGIAVGLATNIPPHNLGECVSAVVAQINNPDISLDELMQHIPCPDFPTGGLLLSSPEIRTAYETGRGKLTMRAKTHFETAKNGKKLIVITELPYQVNKSNMLEKILAVTQEKKLLFAGVADIRDESDRTGIRAVIELKKDADEEKILNYLFKYSDMQCTFGVNIVAIANGKPQQMGLKEILSHYIRHQREVLTRRTRHDLENAQKREHVLAGLMIAIDNLDEVIALIRKSKTPKIAREGLMERFSLSEVQAQAILDLRLQRLTNLELLTIKEEHAELQRKIKEYRAILASEQKLMQLVCTELQEVGDRHNTPRRTALVQGDAEIQVDASALKVVEDVVITLYEGLRARRVPARGYQPPANGDEAPLFTFHTRTDQALRLFTNKGNCLSLSVEALAETRGTARPNNLAALLAFDADESIVAAFEESNDGWYYFFTTQGYVKCTAAAQYATRNKRIAAIAVKDGDEVLSVQTAMEDSVLLISKKGMGIRFLRDTIPEMGRVSAGVKCMKLEADDAVCAAMQVSDEGEILVLSDRGYAKRSLLFDYDIQGRNGKGLKTFDFKKNGSNGTSIAAAFYVREPFQFVTRQRHGTLQTFHTEEVRIEARASKGSLLVLVMLDDDVLSATAIQTEKTVL